MEDDGVVLVVGSGLRFYREYLLASAGQRRRLWLLDRQEPTWEAPHVVATTVVEMLDPARRVADVERLLAAAQKVAADHDVLGVVTYDEYYVAATARIAETLGLPGLSVAAAENCLNKHRTRELLTGAGLAQPRFAFETELDAIRRAAAGIGYPVILKPRALASSMGVLRVANDDELEYAFQVADGISRRWGNPAYAGGVLIEEFLDGPEISVDSAVQHGRHRPFVVAHKRIGFQPYCLEVGHLVRPDDPLLTDPDLQKVLSVAHDALGVRDGITHTEIKLTDRGPVIVEVNARLGGDLIPYLGRLASGVDPAHVLVDVATGVVPTMDATIARAVVGVRFGCAPSDGVVVTAAVPAPDEIDGLIESAVTVPPGTELRVPPRHYFPRYAYVICTGADMETCDAALDAASARLSVTLDPIG
jgi:biotin carboxylase